MFEKFSQLSSLNRRIIERGVEKIHEFKQMTIFHEENNDNGQSTEL